MSSVVKRGAVGGCRRAREGREARSLSLRASVALGGRSLARSLARSLEEEKALAGGNTILRVNDGGAAGERLSAPRALARGVGFLHASGDVNNVMLVPQQQQQQR